MPTVAKRPAKDRSRVDAVTRRWIRNASDEKAVRNGCRFDEERGQFVVDWIQRYCRLYEGEYAGEPLELRDWQYDCTMRMFGWVRYSERWQREVRRFKQASIWIAKKNKKSPTLAAWGMYLLCGDGEPGQKVFLAAKDGQQSREIAGKHAMEMLAQSEELSAECTINRTSMQITHNPSRSILKPLSSSNVRTKESKEGINGCVLIDETHVVDRDFIDRISRAGISRSEPFQIEVSTAGDNPDGYGKERFDYAVNVEKGVFEDEDLFVAIYAAPQTLTDHELDADPLKYARMANPAFGHTVDPEEFLKDYNRSKGSIEKLAKCKMYRLNIWQKATRKWLMDSDWEKCKRQFTADDLIGERCTAALDLSKTRDMTALALAFPAAETALGMRLGITNREWVFLLPYFFLPEETAKRLSHLVPFLTWAEAWLLTLTPGSVLDYGFVRSRFRKLADRYRIESLLYDPKFAEETTQALEQGVQDDEGKMIEAGTGVERIAFGQGFGDMADPVEEFERLVIAGGMLHNGHPVLTWQAGHAQVRTNSKGYKHVVKPTPDDVKKVDGIIAGIMAKAGLKMESDLITEAGIAVVECGENEPQRSDWHREFFGDDDE